MDCGVLTLAQCTPTTALRKFRRPVSPFERVRSDDRHMSRRRPTKAEREAIVTLDLLGNPLAYADLLPAPHSENDWQYFGTITRNGVAGALAWRPGGYGMGIGATVTECGMWDRIKIDRILSQDPPGLDSAPTFALAPPPLNPPGWCP